MQVGVSCRRGGSYFNKRNKGFWQAERPWLLAVEDPNDPDNDLGRNSYNISRVGTADCCYPEGWVLHGLWVPWRLGAVADPWASSHLQAECDGSARVRATVGSACADGMWRALLLPRWR